MRTQQHIVVPETQDSEFLTFQPVRTQSIRKLSVKMLPAIHLDDKPFLEANKIHDIAANGLLPPELVAGQASSSQISPQPHFGIRRHMAHSLGMRKQS